MSPPRPALLESIHPRQPSRVSCGASALTPPGRTSCNAALEVENGMGRCLSLFRMMVVTVGVFALASVAKAASQPVPSPTPDDNQKPTRPQILDYPAPTFHARFSLN